MRSPTVLVIARDPEAQAGAAAAFSAAGMPSLTAADVAAATAQVRQPVDVLILVGELGQPETEAQLRAVQAAPNLAAVPIVLVGSDTSENRFNHALRTGVIDVLAPPLEPARLATTLAGLSQRPGVVHGRGDRRELNALMAHLRRAHRSGALTINPKTSAEGQAMFLRGDLQSASYYGSTGEKALVSMLASATAWSFAEVGGVAGEGPGVVISVDEPAAEIEVEVEAEVPAPAAAPEDEPLTPAPSGEKIPLLLVDDDPELCRMFSLILGRRGFDVKTAADGVEGYASAKAGLYEVIVADLAMPRLDGWGLLRQLRDDFQTREIPLAFLSCHEDYRESLKALDAGAQAYLSKSVRHDALATQIRGLLAPRQKVRAAIKAGSPGPFELEQLGVQWFLRELHRARFTGGLEAGDGWASYELYFEDGAPIAATAQAGQHKAEADRAFNAFVASRSASVQLSPGDAPKAKNLSQSLDDLLRDATHTLNDNERRAKEAMLVKARSVVVNTDLYALYTQVGPRQWLETARLICEEKLPPGEVIAKTDLSPVEVEDTIRDLVRRGVVTLT